MFAVLFEVQPKQEAFDEYLALAKLLKPKLERIDGFIDNDRFASRRTEGRLLSLSTWRDEKALIRWRTVGAHHQIQEKGRLEVFDDYHLRVGEITSDTQAPDGHELVEQRFDETEVGDAKVATITELSPTGADGPGGADPASDLGPGNGGVVDREVFESVYTPGKLLLLTSWRDADAASGWAPRSPAGAELRHRHVRIIRDYGMFDRREAPQYYADVPGRA